MSVAWCLRRLTGLVGTLVAPPLSSLSSLLAAAGAWVGRSSAVAWLSRVLAVVVTAGVVQVAVHDPVYATDAALSCSDSQTDASAAAKMAQQCGQPVEDMSARTPDSQMFANPNGTMELREYLVPRWAKRQDGNWAAVDTSLRVDGGRVVPANTVLPVWFSAGGDAPLASLRSGDEEIAIMWPGTLAEPVIEGSSATYPDVLPDVDLRVTAEPTGFSEVLIVKSRRAAALPALKKVRFGYRTAGLSVVALPEGGAQARDAAGRVVFRSPEPIMWDSRGADAVAAQGASSARAHGQETTTTPVAQLPRVAVMATEVDASHIAVIPDQAMFADPDTQYPVFVDPSWSGGLSGGVWKMVASRANVANSSTFTLNNGSTKGDAGAGRTCDGTVTNGVCPSPGFYLIRSMFRMNLSGVVGKHVLAATFNVRQKWSSTCNPASNARLWLTGGITSSTTWNTQPSWNGSYIADAPANHRVDGAAGCRGAGNVAFNALSMVNNALGQGASYVTVGLRAINEGTMSHWKRFDKATVSLAIVYNTKPNVPDTLTTHGQGCVTGSGRPLVAVAAPTLSARVTDPDGAGEGDINGALKGEFGWESWNPSTSSWSAVGAGQGTPQANGTTSPSPVPSFGEGIWRWRARAADSWSYPGAGSATDYSAWSGWCEFEVDPVAPRPAVITPDAGNSPFVTGKTVRVNLSPGGSPPDTDVTGYNWWVVDGSGTTATRWVAGANVTIDWTPIAGQGTIHVQAKDRIQTSANNATYTFIAAQPSTEVARWPLNEQAGSTTAADSTGTGHTLAADLRGGSTLGAPGRIVNGDTALSMDGTGESSLTASVPEFDTSKSFTVAAWVKLAPGGTGVALCKQDGWDCTISFMKWSGSFPNWNAYLSNGDYSVDFWSTAPAQAGVWTHLAFVYNAGFHAATFYVNGAAQQTEYDIPVFTNVPEPFQVGTDSGGWTFNGSVADVRIWNRRLAAPEIVEVVDPTSAANLTTDMVGQWLVEPESCIGDPAFLCQDSSAYAHDLNLSGGITTTTAGHTGSGLQYTDSDGWARTTDPNTGELGPVLNTDQSFTVSAWMKLDDANPGTPEPDLPTNNRTAVAQTGVKVSGFYLGYRLCNGVAKWSLAIPEADMDLGQDPNAPGSWVSVCSSALTTAAVGQWHHLVATYDAHSGVIKLYANGTLAGSGTRLGARFNTTGALTIGGAWWTDAGGTPRQVDGWSAGTIDTVIAYQGVVPASSIDRIP